jgi:hypothetical protein
VPRTLARVYQRHSENRRRTHSTRPEQTEIKVTSARLLKAGIVAILPFSFLPYHFVEQVAA